MKNKKSNLKYIKGCQRLLEISQIFILSAWQQRYGKNFIEITVLLKISRAEYS